MYLNIAVWQINLGKIQKDLLSQGGKRVVENMLLPDLMEPSKLTISDDNKLNLDYFVEDKDGLHKCSYSNNIYDEIMLLLEYNFSFMSDCWSQLSKFYTKAIENNDDLAYRQFFVKAKKVVKEIEKYSKPVSAIIYLHVQQLEEVYHTVNNDAMQEIWYQLETAVYMQQYINSVITDLCYDELVNEDRKKVPMYKGNIEFNIQIKSCYSNSNYKNIYLINSIEDYYFAVLQAYINSNPMIAQCKYCDKYFVPKTKKATLYCDRITLNGKSCKVLGARSAFRDSIDGDPILKMYYSTKHRLQTYYSRCKLSQHSYLKEYYDWVDKFEPLVQKYKAGEYEGEKLQKEIAESSI